MKKIVTIGIISSIAVLQLNAKYLNTQIDFNKKVEILQKQIEEIKKNNQTKIDALEKEVKQLKANQTKIKSSQDDLSDDLNDRIDEVETSTMTDKIKFGLEFRTRMDNFNQKLSNGDKKSDGNILSTRLRLNMRSKITDNFKFVGRLTMYKNWADSNTNVFSNYDSTQGRRPNNSSLYVTRAYVDWIVERGKVPLILTIGRQPSSDGPSEQFKDNTVRKSTYSALVFDGNADGIVATMPLHKVTGIDDMSFRLAYGKGYQDSNRQSYVGNPNGIADTNVYGAFFETGLGIDGSLFQIGATTAKNVASMTQDKNRADTNKNIGDVNIYSAFAEFTNFKDKGIDFFAHYALSQAKPNGVVTDQNFNGQNVKVGLLTNTAGDTKTKTGYAYWVGARYTLPIKKLHNPKIGLEYNHGNKNWFSFTQGSNDITNKLATRGSAIEGYYIQPINRYVYLRAGVTHINYDYTGSGWQIGAPQDISSQQNALKSLTNTYLLFNLNY